MQVLSHSSLRPWCPPPLPPFCHLSGVPTEDYHQKINSSSTYHSVLGLVSTTVGVIMFPLTSSFARYSCQACRSWSSRLQASVNVAGLSDLPEPGEIASGDPRVHTPLMEQLCQFEIVSLLSLMPQGHSPKWDLFPPLLPSSSSYLHGPQCLQAEDQESFYTIARFKSSDPVAL